MYNVKYIVIYYINNITIAATRWITSLFDIITALGAIKSYLGIFIFIKNYPTGEDVAKSRASNRNSL